MQKYYGKRQLFQMGFGGFICQVILADVIIKIFSPLVKAVVVMQYLWRFKDVYEATSIGKRDKFY